MRNSLKRISHYSIANRSKVLENISNISGDSTSSAAFGKNLFSPKPLSLLVAIYHSAINTVVKLI
jgi:hypothetical protein